RLRYRARFGLLDTPELPGDTRRVFGPDDDLVSDTAAVDARITRADFILISHSHFNHSLDMPYIARKTGATVVATESTTTLARAGCSRPTGTSNPCLTARPRTSGFARSTCSWRKSRRCRRALAWWFPDISRLTCSSRRAGAARNARSDGALAP